MLCALLFLLLLLFFEAPKALYKFPIIINLDVRGSCRPLESISITRCVNRDYDVLGITTLLTTQSVAVIHNAIIIHPSLNQPIDRR